MHESDFASDPASYKDPAGRVIVHHDRIFRIVSKRAQSGFDKSCTSPIVKKLVEKGQIIDWSIVTDDTLANNIRSAAIDIDTYQIIEHPKIPVISYPFEWSFEMLKAAALAHLELHLNLLNDGLTLSDASAYNMQFLNSLPIHIDTLSIIPYEEGKMWEGYGQFLKEFLNPLVLEAESGMDVSTLYKGNLTGIPSLTLYQTLSKWKLWKPSYFIYVYLPAAFELKIQKSTMTSKAPPQTLSRSRLISLLKHLHQTINSLTPPGRESIWKDYTSTHNYEASAVATKESVVADYAARYTPTRLLDVGCNTGQYSEHALRHGASFAVGIDSDRAALDRAYVKTRSEHNALLPLCIDIANPTPSLGWRERERRSFSERYMPDGLLALALLHHLVISRNIRTEDAIDYLVNLANHGVIEFVPKSDSQVVEMLRFREDIFIDYDLSSVRSYISKRANIISEVTLPTDRVLFTFERCI